MPALSEKTSARRCEDLEAILRRIDGRSYGAYKDLKGEYNLGGFTLCVEHVQGDPFAAPSRISLRSATKDTGFPPEWLDSPIRRLALEDFIIRRVHAVLQRGGRRRRGSGKSGLIEIVRHGQAMLERSACRIHEDHMEVLLSVGLPARGRRTLAWSEARPLLLEDLPFVADQCLRASALDAQAVTRHLHTAEDAEVLRAELSRRGWIGFVGDGSILPRRSGASDGPMDRDRALPFRAPEEACATVDCPHAGPIRGMPIREGVTLLVGGGYHGKTTLLEAIAHGVYNHIPGDGRERVVCRQDAACIRAEDGRPVRHVDISLFIGDIPSGEDTRAFTTDDASGSTSQAANIIEALEAGSRLLLIDEDTSATNFMVRDERMQDLVAGKREPITPLLDRIAAFHKDYGVSCVLVVGGSGDFFDVADQVLMMDAYEPYEVTAKARAIAEHHPTRRTREADPNTHLPPLPCRRIDLRSIQPQTASGKERLRARGLDEIEVGLATVDMRRITPFSEPAQLQGVADLLHALCRTPAPHTRSLQGLLCTLERQLDTGGMLGILPRRHGGAARPRLLEVAAALNRLPTLRAHSEAGGASL